LGLWLTGTWLDSLSDKENFLKEEIVSKWKEKVFFLKRSPSGSQTAFKAAENSYADCDEHLANFMVFLENGPAENAGEERDLASKFCRTAHEGMLAQTESKNESERFHAFYALGNINVRRAMLALSSEEQMSALKEAIDSYIEALQIKDDYETKFNLELLISINAQARSAASGKLSPGAFKLSPKSHGATPGTTGKSKL